ncbi:MAG: protein kinase [Chlamydia sp.]
MFEIFKAIFEEMPQEAGAYYTPKKRFGLLYAICSIRNKDGSLSNYAVSKSVIGSGSTRQAKILVPYALRDPTLVKTSLHKENKHNPHLIQNIVLELNISSQLIKRKAQYVLPLQKLENGKKIYTLSQYCKDGTLEKLLESEFYIQNIWHTLNILYQITAGIQELEAIGYCHLDLSLTNILITNKYTKVQLIDLGSAQAIGASFSWRTTFPAPETIISHVRVHPSLDIWSLGILCLYLLDQEKNAGDLDFSAERISLDVVQFQSNILAKEALEQRIQDRIQKIEKQGCSMNISIFLKAILSSDPEKRPPLEAILRFFNKERAASLCL